MLLRSTHATPTISKVRGMSSRQITRRRNFRKALLWHWWRMMVIDENLDPVVTPITQKIQFRVYRKLKSTTQAIHDGRDLFHQTQSAYEIVLRRRALLAGTDGGLRPVSADERASALLVPIDRNSSSYFTGPVVLRMRYVSQCGRYLFRAKLP